MYETSIQMMMMTYDNCYSAVTRKSLQGALTINRCRYVVHTVKISVALKNNIHI